MDGGAKAQRIRNILYRNWDQQLGPGVMVPLTFHNATLVSPVKKPGNDKFAGTVALNNRVAKGMVSHERWFWNNETPL